MIGLSNHVIFTLASVIKLDPSSIDLRAGSISDCDIVPNIRSDSLKTVFNETAIKWCIVFTDDVHNT